MIRASPLVSSTLAPVSRSGGPQPPAAAQLVLFEAPGLRSAATRSSAQSSPATAMRFRRGQSGCSRTMACRPAERVPLSFNLVLPPAPADGPDGPYPLVVFIHGWTNSKEAHRRRCSRASSMPYAQGGYAVLAYDARAWGALVRRRTSSSNSECAGQWNHLADIRYEVRDTQYLAGLLADELSDTGAPLVDPQRIGVTGVSYGGGQSTMLARLRSRVVDPDGSVRRGPARAESRCRSPPPRRSGPGPISPTRCSRTAARSTTH